MARSRGLQRAADKWEARVAVAQEDYNAGVRTPRADWQAETTKAVQRHKDATEKALREGRFAKGVAATPTAEWQKMSLEKGSKRWPEGVSAGKPDFTKGMQPIIAAIDAAVLPERFPAGDPRNNLRTVAMNKAVHEAANK